MSAYLGRNCLFSKRGWRLHISRGMSRFTLEYLYTSKGIERGIHVAVIHIKQLQLLTISYYDSCNYFDV